MRGVEAVEAAVAAVVAAAVAAAAAAAVVELVAAAECTSEAFNLGPLVDWTLRAQARRLERLLNPQQRPPA
eukprot:2845409-Prymnesium_polylepis.1